MNYDLILGELGLLNFYNLASLFRLCSFLANSYDVVTYMLFLQYFWPFSLIDVPERLVRKSVI